MPSIRQSDHRLAAGAALAIAFGLLIQPAAGQFGPSRVLYSGRRGTTVVLPPPGPGPLDPLSVAAYWGNWPNPVLARQPIGHQTIATSPNGYVYRPVYADDPTAASIAFDNSQESMGVPAAGSGPPVGPASSDVLFDAALVLFKSGRYEAAIDRLNRVLDRQPGEGRALLLLVQTYFALSKYEASTEALAAALATAPEFEWGEFVRDYAKYFASPLRFAMHLRSLERFVELHPERFEGHLLLAYQYGSLGKTDRAVAELALVKANVEADKLRRHFAAAGEAPAPAPDDELEDGPRPAADAPPPKRRGREF
ncbi:MAG TPA: tetratricopeptide repeat protein [Pirellulales bacterium]|nr:tetratricopeptide repeat protein [Pirellulales bacterium]